MGSVKYIDLFNADAYQPIFEDLNRIKSGGRENCSLYACSAETWVFCPLIGVYSIGSHGGDSGLETQTGIIQPAFLALQFTDSRLWDFSASINI